MIRSSADNSASHDAPRHTPGPWRFDGNDRWSVALPVPPGQSLRVGRRSTGREILVEGWSAQEAIANAYLVAAAPDLLAALRKIATTPVAPSERNGATNALIAIATKAIAKAEGR